MNTHKHKKERLRNWSILLGGVCAPLCCKLRCPWSGGAQRCFSHAYFSARSPDQALCRRFTEPAKRSKTVKMHWSSNRSKPRQRTLHNLPFTGLLIYASLTIPGALFCGGGGTPAAPGGRCILQQGPLAGQDIAPGLPASMFAAGDLSLLRWPRSGETREHRRGAPRRPRIQDRYGQPRIRDRWAPTRQLL